MLISVGTTAVPRRATSSMQVLGQPGAVLDRVQPGGDQPGQRVLAEDVRGDPRAELVRPRDRRGQDVVRPARGEVADRAVDPVRGDLDPAVAERGLPFDLCHQLLGLDLDAEVADVATGAGDVPRGADQPRQLRTLLDRPVVHR